MVVWLLLAWFKLLAIMSIGLDAMGEEKIEQQSRIYFLVKYLEKILLDGANDTALNFSVGIGHWIWIYKIREYPVVGLACMLFCKFSPLSWASITSDLVFCFRDRDL